MPTGPVVRKAGESDSDTQYRENRAGSRKRSPWEAKRKGGWWKVQAAEGRDPLEHYEVQSESQKGAREQGCQTPELGQPL